MAYQGIRSWAREQSVHFRFCRNPRTGVDVGYKERSPDYSIPPERHAFWELLYLDRGLFRMTVNGKAFTLHQGEYMFIRPGSWHAVQPTSGEAPFYVTAHFETDYAELGSIACRVLQGDNESRRLLSAILKERQRSLPGAEELARCYMIELAIKSVRRAVEPNVASTAGTYFQENHAHNLVDQVIAWMREHLHEFLNLNIIARGAGVSASHLEHVFKKVANRPVMSYLLQLRIQRAKELLLESNLNVTQIAEMSGFSSVHVFSRCFKKAVSFPPSQYAKTVQLAASSDPRQRLGSN